MQVDPLKSKSKDQNESKKKKKNKQKKQKHENLMKQLPMTCFSCSAHPDQFLRIISNPKNKTAPTCKSCGFKLDGQYGYFSCSKTNNCFHLCSSCKICSKSHVLRNVISLSQYTDNELYAQNKFKCHSCKQQKKVDAAKGAYHCNPCSFTICYECMQKTEKLWDDFDKPEQ